MKKTKKISIVTVAVVSLVLGMTGIQGFDSSAAGNPQRVIVTFEQAVNEDARVALESLGGRVLKELPLVDGLVVLLPSEAAVPEIGTIAGVKKVEEDARVFALGQPSGVGKPPWAGGGDEEQPAEVLEWGVDRIDADLAWGASTGLGVKVAVIDTGIDKDHPDLVDNLKGGVNFVSKPSWKDPDPTKWDDDNGHGTHVAGIVGAVDNEIGVIGVAPQAYLYAVKVLDRTGSGYVSDVIDGIDWSMNNGMQVINMSLGTASDVQALHDAVDAAYNAGLVLVAAAGNSGDGDGTTNEVIYPAKYSSVIAVAATASDDSTPYWSSEGEEVELAAPGVDVRSAWKGGGYETKSGTSMASPYAAGTVALVLTTAVGSYDLDGDGMWDPVEVRANLQATADDLGTVGHDNYYGYGLVDAEESVTGVQTQ